MASHVCETLRYPITVSEQGRISCAEHLLDLFLRVKLNKPDTHHLIKKIQEIKNCQRQEPHFRYPNALDIKQTDLLEVILQCIAPSQRLELLQTPGAKKNNMTLLHKAVVHCNASAKIILNSVVNSKNFSLLSLTEYFGLTPLRWACWQGNKEAVGNILSRLCNDSCWVLLQMKGNLYDRTPLHLAAFRGHHSLTMAAKNAVNPEQWIKIICMGDKSQRTPLHLAAERGKDTVIKRFRDSIEEEQLNEVFLQLDEDQCTPLHIAAFEGHANTVQALCESLPDSLWYHASCMPGTLDCTPLHMAAEKGYTDVIEIIRESVPRDKRFDLLKAKDEDHFTPMHSAAFTSHRDAIGILQGFVGAGQWFDFLSAPPPAKFCDEAANSLLDDFRCTVSIAQASTVDESTDDFYGQSQNQYYKSDEVSTDSLQYTIGYGHLRGVILYCTHAHPGAKEDADDMEEALKAIGCQVSKQQWFDAYGIVSLLDPELPTAAESCKFLFICLMSHGHAGTLCGKDESKIAISDILHLLTHSMPQEIPVVVLIQACQKYSTQGVLPPPEHCQLSLPSDPATTACENASNNTEIVLSSPNTVLLLATMVGGEAFRGAFTRAIAEELLYADGKKDIYRMFTDASRNMDLGHLQHPEFRATTKKTLILSEAHNNETFS